MQDKFLFIDTESTKFKKGGALVQDNQARVCQVAMILTNDMGDTLFEMSSLIKPDGWMISDGAREVHGITDQECAAHGIDFRKVVEIYDDIANCATKIIAHSDDFDRGMMEIETAYYKIGCENFTLVEPRREWYCTMKNNKHLSGGKFASLALCLQHYCGRSLGDKAHNAKHDVEACRDIFFAMRGIKR